MKRFGLFLALLFGLCLFGSMGNTSYGVAYAEPESSEPELISSSDPVSAASSEQEEEIEEEFECKVVIGLVNSEHGKISLDKEEGHVGDIVTVTANPNLFYIVEYAEVNGSRLIEDEEISGVYKFALVEGTNKITIKFIVDKALLGEMSVIYEQASNKDWTNLFSLENVVRIVTFLLNGGLLIAMVRYFIKDKKIQKNVESSVKETVSKILPETTRNVVIANTQEVLKPMFEQTASYQAEIVRVLGILVKCIALMQEDTPDSRRAVLAELANLNIGDMKVIEDAKDFIDKYFEGKMADLQNVMNGLDAIINKNKESAEQVADLLSENANEAEQEKSDEGSGDNGTQI